MKYVILLVFPFLLACSKERMQNRKLDGNWELLKVNNQEPSTSYSQILTFEKGKRTGGSGYYTLAEGGDSKKHYFVYDIDNETIHLTYLDKTNGTQLEYIQKVRQNKLALIDSDGNEFLYKKQ